jgi:hypothetical protein
MTPEVIALLSTLSSVAAAMVGFSGLLTAFRVSVETLDPNDVSNIRILLIFSVAALLFAIIPLPFHVVGNDEAMFVALTIALGIFLAVWLWQSPRWMRRHQLKPRNTRLYCRGIFRRQCCILLPGRRPVVPDHGDCCVRGAGLCHASIT